MKKNIILAAFCLLALPSLAAAATSGSVQTGILQMGDGSDPDLGVEVSLSPSVNAVYVQPIDEAAKTTAQWYAIAAGHPGGSFVYGTAQNITNIYKKGISGASELSTVLGDVPASEASESDWSDNSWEK